MTSVQAIYSQVCYALLEDGDFQLGVFTQQQFLDVLGVVILDFCQRAGLFKNIYTQQMVAGTSLYTVPDNVMKLELAFVGGKLIEKVTEADLMQGHFNWRSASDAPRQWHEDNLPPKVLEAFPRPIATGAADTGTYGKFAPAENNLTIVGPAAPDTLTWRMFDDAGNPVNLQCVPDSFSHYLVYGVLEQIFSGDNELRDAQRALYCRTRYLEGISLADAIATEELLEDE